MDVLIAAFRLVHDFPGGATALAPVLDKSPATLSHEVNPRYPTAKLGLADAVLLSEWTRDRRILSAFASQMGCALVPLTTEATGPFDGVSSARAIARESAAFVDTFMACAFKARPSTNDVDRMQAAAMQLVGAIETAVGAIRARQPQTTEPLE